MSRYRENWGEGQEKILKSFILRFLVISSIQPLEQAHTLISLQIPVETDENRSTRYFQFASYFPTFSRQDKNPALPAKKLPSCPFSIQCSVEPHRQREHFRYLHYPIALSLIAPTHLTALNTPKFSSKFWTVRFTPSTIFIFSFSYSSVAFEIWIVWELSPSSSSSASVSLPSSFYLFFLLFIIIWPWYFFTLLIRWN